MASSDPTRPSSRIAGIDGLRAIAAFALVVMHLWWVPFTVHTISPPSDWVQAVIAPLNEGVPMFFVLSGFLLWRPMAAAVIHSRSLPSLRRYAQNRLLRILPAYWVVLFTSAVILETARVTPAAGASVVDGAVRSPGLLLQDALLVQNLRPSTMSSGLTPAWSLAVEAVFYALLPLLAIGSMRLAASRSSQRRRLASALAPAALLLIVGALGKLLATYVVPGPESVFVASWHSVIDSGFLTHADLFAYGMVVAVLRVEHEAGRFELPRWVLPISDRVLANLALPILIIGFWALPRYVLDPIIALLCAVLLLRVVIPASRSGPPRIVRMLEVRPLVALGQISYSVFLWNYPVAVFLTHHGLLAHPDSIGAVAVNLLVGVPIVITLSTATYLLVERPALRLRRGVRRPLAPAVKAPARELELTTP